MFELGWYSEKSPKGTGTKSIYRFIIDFLKCLKVWWICKIITIHFESEINAMVSFVIIKLRYIIVKHLVNPILTKYTHIKKIFSYN